MRYPINYNASVSLSILRGMQGKADFLPVEAREPEPQGRLLNKVGVVCAVALVEAVLTLALSVASLKIEFQASFASLCKLCEAVTRGGNLSVACGI